MTTKVSVKKMTNKEDGHESELEINEARSRRSGLPRENGGGPVAGGRDNRAEETGRGRWRRHTILARQRQKTVEK